MKDNREELILIDGEYYSHQELVAFIESNRELAQRCERQKRFIRALKEDNAQLTDENSFLKRQVNGSRFRIADLRKELDRVTSLGMFEFANEFCNDDQLEDAGHAFARSLGVGVNDDNLAELEFTNNGKAHYEATWNINCGDDF